jgi:hypothetical protein
MSRCDQQARTPLGADKFVVLEEGGEQFELVGLDGGLGAQPAARRLHVLSRGRRLPAYEREHLPDEVRTSLAFDECVTPFRLGVVRPRRELLEQLLHCRSGRGRRPGTSQVKWLGFIEPSVTQARPNDVTDPRSRLQQNQ